MTSPNFDKLFTAAALEMLAAFERSSSGNRPDEIGGPRERQLKTFLKDWLPEKYGISKGYVLNAEKKVSRERDLVVFESGTCPKFFFDKESDVRFFPKNEVYATFEVKSTLNESELNDCVAKIESVKDISGYRGQWLFGDRAWEEHDVQLAECEKTENMWGRIRSVTPEKDDFVDYKLKMKKLVQSYDDTFCGVFAYKSGRKFGLESLRQTFIALKNPPDIVVILNKGLLVKVDDFTLKRLRSLTENKAQYHFNNDSDIFWQKLQLTGWDNKFEYLVLENSSEEVNLMYFYIFLIDFLNEFKKHPDSYAADIVSVWKQT